MQVRLIYNHIEHHARHSGYDQLAKYVDAKAYEAGGLSHRVVNKIGIKRLREFSYYKSNWYGGPALRRELEICLRMLKPTGTIYHFFYAENDLRHSALWKVRLNNKIVGSFHQPPEFLDDHEPDKRYIQGVNGIVVMSESQIPYFEQYVPRKKIHHVPHGVATEYWCPDPEVTKWEKPTFLVVGQWLRDIEMVSEVIRKLNAAGDDIHFKIVTFPEHVAQFDGLKNVQVMTGIPDEQLLEEFRRAHALFLPLKMSTANNAVLEAMACGTGVVSTRTGGVPEYVCDDSSRLVDSGDIDAAVEVVRKLSADRDQVERMGRAARDRAVEKYAWPVVGAQMMDAYRKM